MNSKNNTIKMYVLVFGILALGLLSAFICYGQTNTPPSLPAYPDSTPQDILKVLQDFGVQNISIPTIGGWLFIVYSAVKILRNKTSLGQGAIGQFLASVLNFEAKAELPPSPPIPPAVPQSPPKP